MFYRLPPAGDRIVLQSVSSPDEILRGSLGAYAHRFYNSGTSALAAALIAAIKLGPKPKPEVLIPAYTCPALVSAALFAGARPVLVDFEPNRPWMDLGDLQRKISSQTVAVIAVHLFGIPERLSQIKEITNTAKISLIEDSAQYLPLLYDPPWIGDFIVLSLGRGKPASLLHGGAVLTKDPSYRLALPKPTASGKPQWLQTLQFTVKVWIYNVLRFPFLYWLPASLPFLRVGETRFEPLHSIIGADQVLLDNLGAALAAYRRYTDQAQTQIAEIFAHIQSPIIVDLPRQCCGRALPRLLRYPILITNEAMRNTLFNALSAEGLGVSKMYPSTLPHIPGLQHIVAQQESLTNAEEFSHNVLTLPTHTGVKPWHLKHMNDIFEKLLPHG
jgi:dTDP-4-amino-4,6-dideoxygalactose transaminase